MNYLASKIGHGLAILAALTLSLSGCAEPRSELAAPIIDEITVKKLQEPTT